MAKLVKGPLTGAVIKTRYEGESDTNAFDDAAQSKLSGVEASADVTDETNVLAALANSSATKDVAGATIDNVGAINLDALSLNINDDATTTDEDPYVALLGGDGAETVRTVLIQDSSADKAYLTTAVSSDAVTETDRDTELVIGPQTQVSNDAGSHDSMLTLRSHDAGAGAGVFVDAQIKADGTTLLVDGNGHTNVKIQRDATHFIEVSPSEVVFSATNIRPFSDVGSNLGRTDRRFFILRCGALDIDTTSGGRETLQLDNAGVACTIGNTTDNTTLDLVGTGATTLGGTLTTQGASAGLADATNGQACALKVLNEEHTLAAAATSDTTIQIPADALVAFVAIRVTTEIAGCTSLDYGVAGATTRYGTGLALTAGTTNKGPDSGGSPLFYTGATSIRFSAIGGAASFSAGVVRTSIYYWEATAPTS